MQTLKHSRWGYTFILVSLVAVLALTGGTWGTSQAAGAQAPQAVPSLTSINPVLVKTGGADFIMTIVGTNFVNADRTGVRFYQWGTHLPGTGVDDLYWEFIPVTISSTEITISIPARFILSPNRFSVAVVNYSVDIPNPTSPTVPADIPPMPPTPYDPGIPPVITADYIWEELSPTSQIFNVTDHLYFLPVILR